VDLVVLILITFVAATVDFALGYGFSSITVPVALIFYTNRILNPVLVLVELVINGYVLFINRKSIPNIRWRVAPILIGPPRSPSILTIQHLTIVTMLNAYLLFRFFRDRAVP